MQRKILKLLMFVSKTVYYLFILQLVGLQLLMANDTRGQSLQKIRISLEVEDASIKEVFNVIESKTDLSFVHDRVLDEIRTEFDLSYKDETL